MSAAILARAPVADNLRQYWRWIILAGVVLLSRLYLLGIYDVELSQDGFEAVRTITLLQVEGTSTVPRDLLDRFILHPLYMLLLFAWRLIIPAPVDFYLAARFLSVLLGCVTVILLFEFTRRAYGQVAAWIAALLLAFAPTSLWESITILSSTLFLSLYLAVLLALYRERFGLAALLGLLASLTRYEGIVLLALVLLALAYRDGRARRVRVADWVTAIALTLAFPFSLAFGGWLMTGSALEFLGAQSMASIWLRFLAPGDFARRAGFFITQYHRLFPTPFVFLGIAGAVLALWRHRGRVTALLLLASALYLIFFETLVWFDYTTLEVRFLMYPGLPLLIFAGVALADATRGAVFLSTRMMRGVEKKEPARLIDWAIRAAIPVIVAVLCLQGYQQGIAGMNFQYNSMASQREMAEELAHLVPPHRRTNLLANTGTSGALDLYGRQYGLEFAFTDFRFAPDANAEQFLVERRIEYIIYPVGNAFAGAKYPYLARFEAQTHGSVEFRPLTQFATSTDNQLYSIWSVTW